MKKIELEGKEYSYPTSWYEVSISKYQKIHAFIEEIKEENDEDVLESINNQIRIISLYCDIPVEVLKKEKPEKVMSLIKDLSFFKEEIPSKQIDEFLFKNEKYYVIQSLLQQEFQTFISLENIMQRDNFVGNLHWVMAVMARKTYDESLDDYDVEARAKEFLDLDVVTVNNVSIFFYTCAKAYNLTLQLSSNPMEVVEMKVKEVEESFSEKRDGLGWLTRLQIGLIRLWFRSYVRSVRKYSIFTQAESSKTNSKQPRWKKLIEKISKKIWNNKK